MPSASSPEEEAQVLGTEGSVRNVDVQAIWALELEGKISVLTWLQS